MGSRQIVLELQAEISTEIEKEVTESGSFGKVITFEVIVLSQNPNDAYCQAILDANKPDSTNGCHLRASLTHAVIRGNLS